jgi:hypothetical protein
MAKVSSIGGSIFCIWKALQLTRGSAVQGGALSRDLMGWSEARKLTSLATTSIQMSFFLQSNKKMNFTLTVDDEKSSSMNLDVGKRRVMINPLMWSNGPNENNDFITLLQWLS